MAAFRCPLAAEPSLDDVLAERPGPRSKSTFGHRSDLHNLLRLSGVAHRVADRFGTLGSPISINTACASVWATAIHMGVEAIRRGETDAALVVGADGSINVELLIRFSLLSALSTRNEMPEEAARRFSKSRDGFVMAEGGALVLESLFSARARNADISLLSRAAANAPIAITARAAIPTAPPSSARCAMRSPTPAPLPTKLTA